MGWAFYKPFQSTPLSCSILILVIFRLSVRPTFKRIRLANNIKSCQNVWPCKTIISLCLTLSFFFPWLDLVVCDVFCIAMRKALPHSWLHFFFFYNKRVANIKVEGSISSSRFHFVSIGGSPDFNASFITIRPLFVFFFLSYVMYACDWLPTIRKLFEGKIHAQFFLFY